MLWLRFCTGFFGVWEAVGRCWQVLCVGRPLLWRVGESWRWGGGGRVMSGWVGLCRVKVGSGRGVFSFLGLVWLGLGAYEVERVMNKSCADGEVVGRVLAGIWRE